MPGKAIDHTGQRFGPLTVVKPAARKRYWRVRCGQGHVTERRIDHLLRLKESSISCPDCRRKPATAQDALARFQERIAAALRDLAQAVAQ